MPGTSPLPEADARRSFRRRRRTALALGLGVLAIVTTPARGAHAQSSGLRDLADAADILFGVAVDSDALATDGDYADLIVGNANMASTIREFDFAAVQPEPGVFDLSRPDAVVEFAADNDMTARGHGLVSSTRLPDWILDGSWTAETLGQVLRDHVTTVVAHYAERFPGVVTQWDVVDEAFLPDGALRNNIWRQVIGDDYLRIAFDAAHAADPAARLFYNDFYDDLAVTQDAVASGVPIVPGATRERSRCDDVPKCVGVRGVIGGLVADGAPIGGVGVQSRLLSPDPLDIGQFTTWVEDLGLRWAITEFDVPVPVTEIADPVTLAFQADAFARALRACVDSTACDTFVSSGVTDRVSSAPFETGGAFGGALFLDAAGAPKPAFDAMAEVLTSEMAVTTTEPLGTAAPNTVAQADTMLTPAGDDEGSDADNGTVTALVVGGVSLAVLAAIIALARRRVRAARPPSA
jgi:endo-1,4-beta-xylanase